MSRKNGKGYCKTCQYNINRNSMVDIVRTNAILSDINNHLENPIGLCPENVTRLLKLQNGKCALIPSLKFLNVVRGDPHSAFSLALTRKDVTISHDIDNVMFICSFFNTVDRNVLRVQHRLVVPVGFEQPFSYNWTKNDIVILRNLLNKFFINIKK